MGRVKMGRVKLTQERLKELLHYDPETGIFTRLTLVGGQHAGSIAGKPNSEGYLCTSVDKHEHKAHRLAFLYMEGYLPEHQVDHLNGIRDDNRWVNLRHATQSCNSQNCRLQSNNTSGVPGVSWHKRSRAWIAHIYVSGSKRYLGGYDDILEASLARLTAEVWCPYWTCNHRSELVKAIKNVWPEFNERSLK